MGDEDREAGKLKVFISYSRDDLDFADQLDAALKLHRYDIAFDRHGISGGEDWKRRLGGLIRDADSIVFALSPSSAQSPTCKWEVEEAVRLGKQILPVLCRPLQGTPALPQLAELNYIFFYSDPTTPGTGFGTGLSRLASALDTDLDWLREHTRLLQRATEWNAGGQPANRLLSGTDIAAAKTWAALRPKDAPAPTALHLDFIRASETWELERQSEESRRLEERERLVREAESAQQERDAASRRVVQRTLAGLAAALVLAVLAGIAAFYGYLQQRDATAQAERAERARIVAEQATKVAEAAGRVAQMNQFRLLAGQSAAATQKGDPVSGLLLALEGLPDTTSDDEEVKARQYWPGVEVSLEAARRMLMPTDGAASATPRSGRAKKDPELHVIRVSDQVNAVAVTPDGTRVVAGSADGVVRIWDIKNGTEIAQGRGHDSGIFAVAVAPTGDRIVSGSGDGTARVWDATTLAPLAVLRGHDGPVWTVAVTPDGGRIVTGSADATARIWDAQTGKEIRQLKGHALEVIGVAVMLDGTRIVTSSSDTTARIWDAETGAEITQLTGHTRPIKGVTVTPDGTRIITTSHDNTVRVWDARTGTELAQLKGHTDAVRSVAVLRDGRIVTGSFDQTVRIWDPRIGADIALLSSHTEQVTSVAVTRDGGYLVSGSGDGTVRIWEVFPFGQALIEQAQALAPRCLTPGERKRNFLAPLPPRWCGVREKWPYDREGAFSEAENLLGADRVEEDQEAEVIFAALLQRDPGTKKRIDDVWVKTYIRRADFLFQAKKLEEANAQLAIALKRDPAAAGEVEKIKAEWGTGR